MRSLSPAPWVLLTALAWLASGCKPNTSEFTFPEDYAAAMCEKSGICQWSELPDDFGECTALLQEAVESEADYCTNFSIVNARKCLSEIRKMTCDQGAPYQEPGRYPGTCSAVYSCYATTF